jgi:argininosuccinate lyase
MAEPASIYTSSIMDDERIKDAVIDINMAHVLALLKAKWITVDDAGKILNELLQARKEVKLDYKLEDVHMCIEDFILKRIGAVGGFLPLGRSRNDHVAGALRLVLRGELLRVIELSTELLQAMLDKALEHHKTIMPGYTHSQPAQPTTVGHWLLSYVDMMMRDLERIKEAYKRVNRSPLGSAALTGSRAWVDRKYLAELLGFEGVIENTMDAVGSRDFILEALFTLSSIMLTISRFAEDLIFFSSQEVSFIKISDHYISTSSIMPQKRNAVVAEISRAKAGSMISRFVAVAFILKGLNQTYNLDFQEVTRHLWPSVDEVKSTLLVYAGMVKELEFDERRMVKVAERGFVTASDVAEHLSISYGIPFREAHRLVGMVTKRAERGKFRSKKDVSRELLKHLRPYFKKERNFSDKELIKVMDLHNSIKSRRTLGGPSPKEVKRMIEDRKDKINNIRTWVALKMNAINEYRKRLDLEVMKVKGGDVI